MSGISQEIIAEHGLTAEEYKKACDNLGREPNLTELGVISALWSEDCSYKSSKKQLRKLPTSADFIICGPGENAGIINIGDGDALAFKIENHNNPSLIEPHHGAATGVGGIIRDVFTMGARPIALLNSIRFGDIKHPKTKHYINGVVSGIGWYGNCIGVPNVGGECNFHSSYNDNILVNTMCIGVLKRSKIFYSGAFQSDSEVVCVGSKTGRDGINTSNTKSREYIEKSDPTKKKPNIQIGDPFVGKILMEACLELMQYEAILCIQDMGEGGLASAALEMVAKSGKGIELNLDLVPVRESDMTAHEIMLSESQERMLMVIRPEQKDLMKQICDKWDVEFAIIGKITDTGICVLKMQGEICAELPVTKFFHNIPYYSREHKTLDKPKEISPDEVKDINILEALRTLLSCPDLSSKHQISEQYDSTVMANTIHGPGSDAAIVRINDEKAVALCTDSTPRYCYADPYEGGKQVVTECWRNLVAVGSDPIAITNCLNFGSPERPDIFAQFVGVIDGMAEACTKLNFPVVSGNVSFYNELGGQAIFPTPVIGGVGIFKDIKSKMGSRIKAIGEQLVLIGETKGHIGSSLLLREVLKREEGAPPKVDFATEIKIAQCLKNLNHFKLLSACHDVSDGGILIAVIEMALNSGFGLKLNITDTPVNLPAFLFGEDQARYIVSATPESIQKVMTFCKMEGIPSMLLGEATEPREIKINDMSIGFREAESLNKWTLTKLFS